MQAPATGVAMGGGDPGNPWPWLSRSALKRMAANAPAAHPRSARALLTRRRTGYLNNRERRSGAVPASGAHHCLGLDFNLVVADECRGLDQGVCGTHAAEVAAVHARGRFPLRGVAQIDARADHVLKRATERPDAGGDLVEDVDRLACDVAGTNHLAPCVAGAGLRMQP